MQIRIPLKKKKDHKITRNGRKHGGAYIQITEAACLALEDAMDKIDTDINIKTLASILIEAAAKDAEYVIEA